MKANRIKARFLAELDEWLTPELLYHCFTGESDPYELARIAGLGHVLQSSLLGKVERIWPDRLAAIEGARHRQKEMDKAAVHQYFLKLSA